MTDTERLLAAEFTFIQFAWFHLLICLFMTGMAVLYSMGLSIIVFGLFTGLGLFFLAEAYGMTS